MRIHIDWRVADVCTGDSIHSTVSLSLEMTKFLVFLCAISYVFVRVQAIVLLHHSLLKRQSSLVLSEGQSNFTTTVDYANMISVRTQQQNFRGSQ